jgi:hypothetical protein
VKKGRGRGGRGRELGGKGSGIGRGEGEGAGRKGQEGREENFGWGRRGRGGSLVLTPLLFSDNSHTGLSGAYICNKTKIKLKLNKNLLETY